MKKVIFLLLFAAFSIQLPAQTIHWLTFIDTTDGNGTGRGVGEIDRNTRTLLYSRWIDLVNATLNEEGYKIHVMDVYDKMTSPENCKSIVNDLQCGKDDIVVFYYVGHGTENSYTSKYPLMLMAQSDANKLIPLSWVHDTLKKKGARLTISIGMCCNAAQGVPGRIAPSFGVNYGNTYVDSDMADCIKEMFLGYKGDLIVTSASPKESSWACTSNLGPTDYFTLNLLIQFNNILPEKSKCSWEQMLSEIKESVAEDLKNDREIQRAFPGTTQTPIWDANLSLVSASGQGANPAPPVTQPKSQPQSQTNNKTLLKAALGEALSYISSSKADPSDRISTAAELRSVFKESTIVRIMSQDGHVVVDKENIDSFLDRIATSRLLMNVSVDNLQLDQSGKIVSLRVRESYKKK